MRPAEVEAVGAYIFTYPFLQEIPAGGTAAQVPLMIDRENRRISRWRFRHCHR